MVETFYMSITALLRVRSRLNHSLICSVAMGLYDIRVMQKRLKLITPYSINSRAF